MPSVKVRFLDGETDEWDLHERASVDKIFDLFASSMKRSSSGFVGFGIQSQEGDSAGDYSRLFVQLAQVATVEIHGMLDEKVLLGLWPEPDGEGDPN